MRSDIFAFGVLVYEMITGTRPFRAASQAQLLGAILRDDPPPVIDLVPDVSPRLAQTLARCLSKDPDDRWQSANDLLFELRSIAHSPAAVAGAPSRRAGSPGVVERVTVGGGDRRVRGRHVLVGASQRSASRRRRTRAASDPLHAVPCPGDDALLPALVCRSRCRRTGDRSSMPAPAPTAPSGCGFALSTRSSSSLCRAPKGRTRRSGHPTASGSDSSRQTA